MSQRPDHRLSIIVTGRVQGVGYRFFSKENARVFGITGWVRNCANGNVELEAQGKKALLDQFCKVLKKGPLFGQVSELLSREIEIIRNENAFKIHY